MEYRPSESVDRPVLVPFTNTDTPGRGAPSVLVVTLPEMVCAIAKPLLRKRKTNKKTDKRFFIGCDLGNDLKVEYGINNTLGCILPYQFCIRTAFQGCPLYREI
jgi:hypothetical protein